MIGDKCKWPGGMDLKLANLCVAGLGRKIQGGKDG